MKESISYSFLLNIIILFVFVCGAIITGIFSYYRAVKANTLILNEIEKYEGYNCLTKESINKKLSSVSYNTPFTAKCRNDYGTQCVVDDSGNYAVYSYNTDSVQSGEFVYNDKMNSKMSCDSNGKCRSTKKYQYGVVTYMYVDMPVVSNLLKISYFSKTRVMNEFRNLKRVNIRDTTNEDGIKIPQYVIIDYNYIPSDISTKYQDDEYFDENNPSFVYSSRILKNFNEINVMGGDHYLFGYDPYIFGNGIRPSSSYSMRDAFRYYRKNATDANAFLSEGKFQCGYDFDWSVY